MRFWLNWDPACREHTKNLQSIQEIKLLECGSWLWHCFRLKSLKCASFRWTEIERVECARQICNRSRLRGAKRWNSWDPLVESRRWLCNCSIEEERREELKLLLEELNANPSSGKKCESISQRWTYWGDWKPYPASFICSKKKKKPYPACNQFAKRSSPSCEMPVQLKRRIYRRKHRND